MEVIQYSTIVKQACRQGYTAYTQWKGPGTHGGPGGGLRGPIGVHLDLDGEITGKETSKKTCTLSIIAHVITNGNLVILVSLCISSCTVYFMSTHC